MTPLDPTTGTGPSQRDPHHGEGVDADPTGVRALLQGLPDPGPMPADVIARIERRLAAERDRPGAGVPVPVSPKTVQPVEPVDLAAARSRRRPARTLTWLGAAAAGLVVGSVALNQVIDPSSLSDGTTAYAPASSISSDRGAGSGPAADEDAGPEGVGDDSGSGMDPAGAGSEEAATEDAGTDSPAAELHSGSDDSPSIFGSGEGSGLGDAAAVVVIAPLGEIADDFGAQAHEALRRPIAAQVPAGDALTAAQAISCWSSVDAPGWDQRLAAAGSRDGESVVVLVGLHGSAATDGDEGRDGHAWLLPRSCTSQTVTVIDDQPLTP